ncbi:MAG: glycosyltransferase family 4 protein, partial [Jatrophihabitantaceae bacterium]
GDQPESCQGVPRDAEGRPMTEARRTLLLVLGNSTGGIGSHVASLSAACVQHGWQVTICAPVAVDELFSLAETGAEVTPLPVGLRLLLYTSARRQLRAMLTSPDVVHAHGLQAGVVVTALAGQRPVVVSWHNAPLSAGPRRWLHRLLEQFTARRASVTVGASEDLVARARRAGAADARFVPVAPPPARRSGLSPQEVRDSLGIGQSPVVLAVGRLHRQKRFDVLVAAAARWPGLDPVPVVLIAGEGPEREALERQIARLSVGVRLLGQRGDVDDLLSVADVVVLPSSWEARPLAAQQALLSGRALVATAVGGVPSLVGSAAVLVPVGTPAAIASAVTRLLSEPETRHALEREALARSATWPDSQQVADQLMAVYDELLAR